MRTVHRRRRIGALTAGAALVAVTVFPAGAGATAPPPDFPDAGTLVLSLGDAGDRFAYDPPAGAQSIQELSADRCVVTTEASLISLSAPKVGLVDHSLGVKTGGATGVPCGRVDGTESLTLALAGEIAGLEVSSAELDVEVKASAVAVASLFLDGVPVGTRTLRSGTSVVGAPPAGTSDCSAQSDSGPDAGAADNCRWEITGILFDALTLTVTTGEISLEGGDDYGEPGHETVFHLTDVDVLGCGETATTDLVGSTNELTNIAGAGCVPVVYFLRPVSGGVWLWKDPATETAQLIWTTVWDPEPAPVGEALQIPPTLVDIALDDGIAAAPLEWCGLEGGSYVVPTDPGWCMASQSAETVGDGYIQVTDTAVGDVDPFKLR